MLPVFLFNIFLIFNVVKQVLGLENEVYAILDTLKYVKAEYDTLCVGQAFGNAILLLASGIKGKR